MWHCSRHAKMNFHRMMILMTPADIQVVWDLNDKSTLEREERALRLAENELGIKGRLIDCESYLRNLA